MVSAPLPGAIQIGKTEVMLLVSWIPAAGPMMSPSVPPVKVVIKSPSNPSAPLVPATPVAPTGPVCPVGPVFPVFPARPVTPCAPAGPTSPVDPSGPVGPTTPTEPCEPVGPAAPVGPLGPWGPAAPGMFHTKRRLWGWQKGRSTPTILPFLAMQSVMSCALAAGAILAINIAAADAPTSQRHAFLND